ncbi:MAG: hypothetical protein DA328_05770 [Nitrososphaeraceae archaeon]|nr:hypothetical protein [Nitrososphaeraceae archaeon]
MYEKRIEKIAKVMFDKTTMMMKIYLGNSPGPEVLPVSRHTRRCKDNSVNFKIQFQNKLKKRILKNYKNNIY